MNVGQRRGQLAILRALGANCRGQLVGMLLSEGLALGVGGTVLGCVAGWGSAHLLAAAMGGILAAPPPDIVVGAVPFRTGAVVGLGAVAAGLFSSPHGRTNCALEGMRPAFPTPRAPCRVAAGRQLSASMASRRPLVTASLEGLCPTASFCPAASRS